MALKNFDGKVTLLNGRPVVNPGADGTNVQPTYLDLIVDALSVVSEADQKLSVAEKRKKGDFIAKLIKGGDIELDIQELATIETAVCAAFTNYQIIHQILELTKAT